MSSESDPFAALSQRPESTAHGVAATVGTIHRDPALRSFVTIESVAQPPVPTRRGGGWSVLALLAVPSRREHGTTQEYHAPWAAIEWSWPERRVARTLNLVTDPAAQQLARGHEVIAARPAGGRAPLSLEERNQALAALFAALDAFLAAPSNDGARLAALAPLYAALLADDLYPYYWLLAPDTAAWLRPAGAIGAGSSAPLGGALDPWADVAGTAAFAPGEWDVTSDASAQAEDGSPLPTNLSARAASWLRAAQALADRAGARAISGELSALSRHQQLPGFRMAFAGEFSRGKSTLINRLLERPVLPTGVTPTTATLTAIVAGDEERMVVRFPDGRVETRPVDDAAWAGLIAEQQPGDMVQFPQVRLTLRQAWLKGLDAELIDTPGAGDLNTRRAALVYEVLSQSDAVVFLVSAYAPFSLTERAFLEDEVLARHIPRVVVVVSHLDAIPEDERARVFEHVGARVAQIAPDIPVLPSQAVGSYATSDAALAAVRQAIDAIAAASDRPVWRSRQCAQLVADYLAQLAAFGEAAIAAAHMSAADREEALRQTRVAEGALAQRWEQLGGELDQRRLLVEQELRERIDRARDDLIEQLDHDLDHTANPKVWWDKDVPYFVHRHLVSMGRNTEATLTSALARDADWLRTALAQTFGASLTPSALPAEDIREPEVAAGRVRLPDLQKVRLYSRIGSGAATVLSYILLMPIGAAPIGVAASVGSGIVADQFVNRKVDEQRKVLRRQLEPAVSQALDDYRARVAQRLREVYTQLAQAMRREQEVWQTTRTSALMQAQADGEEAGWNQLIAEATTLRAEIVAALAE